MDEVGGLDDGSYEQEQVPEWYVKYVKEKWKDHHNNFGEGDYPAFGYSVGGSASGIGQIFKASRDISDTSADPLTRDVAFNKHSLNDGSHVSPLDNNTIQVGTDGIEVRMIQGLDEASFKRTLSLALRATTGVDLRLPLEDGDADAEEMLTGGLQAALESQVIVFAVSGVSRACTHQLVRTRKAGFHQQSQRATFYGLAPETRMPESVWRDPVSRQAFLDATASAHEAYQIATERGISYQDARLVLGEGTTNYILCEYTVREFINTYAYRGCSMFNWEIVNVFRQMRKLLVEAHPFLEPHVKISCEKTKGALDYMDVLPGLGKEDDRAHTCTFQGWEQVEGQCDFPWARDSNRTFRSKTYEIGKRPDDKEKK